jgi:hypothetical protein
MGQGKLNLTRQSCCFGEIDEIFQRETQINWFRQINLNIEIWLIDVGVLAKSNCTLANITRSFELDTIFGTFNGNCPYVNKS